MSWNAYFVQACTTCGRKLQVQVVDLGKELVCQHCGAVFLTADNSKLPESSHDPTNYSIELAEQFLDTTVTERSV